MRLWLKADVGAVDAQGNPVAVGGTLHEWLDQGTHDCDAAVRQGAPKLQTISRGGNEIPVIRFDGSAGFETSLGAFGGESGGAAGALVFVAEQTQGGNQKWFGWRESVADTQLSWLGTGNQGDGDAIDFGLGYTSGDADRIEANAVAPSGGLHVYALVWGEEAGRITARLFIDGRLKHEVTKDADFAENLRYDDVLLRIGQRAWADSGFFIGDLGEVLFYDERLSFQQINNVGAYLAQKYAIDAEFLFALAGDLNGDGFVGSDDLDIVRVNWGASVEPGRWDLGDPSGDGMVNSTDLDVIRANWGNGTQPATVPEPGFWGIVVSGAAWWMWNVRGLR